MKTYFKKIQTIGNSKGIIIPEEYLLRMKHLYCELIEGKPLKELVVVEEGRFLVVAPVEVLDEFKHLFYKKGR